MEVQTISRVYPVDKTAAKQKEIIAVLQSAVQYCLGNNDLELAQEYSQLLNSACESYSFLVAFNEQPATKKTFPFKPPSFSAQKLPPVVQEYEREVDEVPNKDYQSRMQGMYNGQPSNSNGVNYTNAQQQPIVSRYTYGDGVDNPKIRANDSNGNWSNNHPNEIIAPVQQVFGQSVNSMNNDLWEEDSRRSFNK
jgi:hypothetical protein